MDSKLCSGDWVAQTKAAKDCCGPLDPLQVRKRGKEEERKRDKEEERGWVGGGGETSCYIQEHVLQCGVVVACVVARML